MRALQQVNLDVVDWERCNSAIRNSNIPSPYQLTPTMMCAGGGHGHDGCSVGNTFRVLSICEVVMFVSYYENSPKIVAASKRS